MQGLSLVSHAESALQWPAHFQVFKHDSDDMEPFIKKGSYVVVDTLYKEIVDAPYALDFGGNPVVKRLQRLSGGRILVISDNALYESFEVPLQEISPEMILGRIRLVETRLF